MTPVILGGAQLSERFHLVLIPVDEWNLCRYCGAACIRSRARSSHERICAKRPKAEGT